MTEYETELMKALENVNLQYIEISNSREYLLGSRIIQFKNSIRNFNISEIYFMIKRKRAKKKLNKIYAINRPTNIKFEVEQIQDLVCKEKAKVAVYTCILGGYDRIADPILHNKGFDYYVFTDERVDSAIWKTLEIPKQLMRLGDKTKINRYIKLHPAELFSEYDYTIYIDGNVTVVSDLSVMLKHAICTTGIAMHRHAIRDCIYEEGNACILYGKGNPIKLKEQLVLYKSNGFPEHYGMLEGTVILSDLSNKTTAKILNAWWEEFLRSESQRDQIALPYILWKYGLPVSNVGNLGNNVYLNPKFRVKSH